MKPSPSPRNVPGCRMESAWRCVRSPANVPWPQKPALRWSWRTRNLSIAWLETGREGSDHSRRRRFQAYHSPPANQNKQTKERKETVMAQYVDGFVLPVPKKNLAAYRRMATKASKIWKEY